MTLSSVPAALLPSATHHPPLTALPYGRGCLADDSLRRTAPPEQQRDSACNALLECARHDAAGRRPGTPWGRGAGALARTAHPGACCWACSAPVSSLTWEQVKDVDIGSWKDTRFASERLLVPLLPSLLLLLLLPLLPLRLLLL